ncbi:MAG: thioredoxin family protein [Planctomycetes bacterium]|nr:thioredoxin family protein [Planctomycetota bacterium]
MRRMAAPSESGRLPFPEEVGGPPLEGSPVDLFDDVSFQADVLDASVPVIVEFFTETCVPCRIQEPAIRRLAEATAGRLKVGRMNAFDCPRTTRAYRIQGVPHMLVFRDGQPVADLVGQHTFEELVRRLQPLELL